MASVPIDTAKVAEAVIRTLGQELVTARSVAGGTAGETRDGWIYLVLDGRALPEHRALLDHAVAEVRRRRLHLAILTPQPLPSPEGERVAAHGGAVVSGSRFALLLQELGLERFLPVSDRPGRTTERRTLPSQDRLYDWMERGRNWLAWGVPAMALRCFREAAQLKPDFLPAQLAEVTALAVLGRFDVAEALLERVTRSNGETPEIELARVVLRARGKHPDSEVEDLIALSARHPERADVRAHLLAARIARREWREGLRTVEELLVSFPDEPGMRFLRAELLARLDQSAAAEAERTRARSLGLDRETESRLRAEFPDPSPPPETTPQA